MPKDQPTSVEPHWHMQLAVAAALLLQIILPDRFVAGPRFLVPLLEIMLLVALAITTPRLPIFHSVTRKISAVTLISLITLTNLYALQRLTHALLAGGAITNGGQLILAALNLYLTNIIIFGLWFWELDSGGPGRREGVQPRDRDFIFPQMATPQLAPKRWRATFIDYLYVSLTNAMAFSPTDTMPVTRRAKMLMGLQAVISLVVIALVAARAVNILK